MASAGCTEFPADLVAAIRSEFKIENHPDLHAMLDQGSAHKVRHYLWVASRSKRIFKEAERVRRAGRSNFKTRRNDRRLALYEHWVDTATNLSAANDEPRGALAW